MPHGDGKKNHSVNRERAIAAQKRHKRQRAASASAREKWMKAKTQQLRYWKHGDVDHP